MPPDKPATTATNADRELNIVHARLDGIDSLARDLHGGQTAYTFQRNCIVEHVSRIRSSLERLADCLPPAQTAMSCDEHDWQADVDGNTYCAKCNACPHADSRAGAPGPPDAGAVVMESGPHPKKNKHESAFVDLPGYGPAEIDLKMIPLITELNRMGLTTLACCEGGKGSSDGARSITLGLRNMNADIKYNGIRDGAVLIIRWWWDDAAKKRLPPWSKAEEG